MIGTGKSFACRAEPKEAREQTLTGFFKKRDLKIIF